MKQKTEHIKKTLLRKVVSLRIGVHKSGFFLFLLLLASSFGYAQSAMVKATIDTTNIRIGEQFIYKISVDGTENVIIPKLSLKGLEVVDSLKMDTIKNKLIKKYVLTGFDSGAFYIPQQQIFIRNQAYLTDSLLVNVATVPIDTTKIKKFPIKGIKGEPYRFDDFKKYIYWLLGGLLLIGLLLYFFVFRKKKQEEIKEIEPLIPPYEEAIEKLKSLDNKLLWQNNKIKQYYSELTDIVRNYLGRDIEIPTLELTSNEIVDLVINENRNKSLDLTKDSITNIDSLLKSADLVKFAKLKPLAQDIEFDRKKAEQIIKEVKPKVEKYRHKIEIEESKLLEERKINKPIKQSPVTESKKNNRLQNKKNMQKTGFVIFLIVFLFVGFFVGKKAVNFVSKKFDVTTEKLAKGNWKYYTYGNPTVTIESPVEVPKENLSGLMTEEVKQYVTSMDVYSYKNLLNNLQIAVATSVYIPKIQANLEGAVNGAIMKIQQQPNISNLKHTVEAYDKFGVESAILQGSYKENAIYKEFKSVVIPEKNTIRIIVVSYKKDDEKGKEVCDRIINSIKIKNAE